MKTTRYLEKILVVLLVTLLGSAGGVPAVAADREEALRITVLSNRADLISGGDALVEVVLPPDVAPSKVRVTVNGHDVSGAFAVRADGRFYGLITGLALGRNEVVAVVLPSESKHSRETESARIVITNHPIGGPVFSGAQLQPWICARVVSTPVTVTVPGTTLSAPAMTRVSGLDADPVDEQCNAPTKFTYFYQPKSKEGTACTFTTTGTNPCLVPYDPSSPPVDADIANFTNDRGDTVKSILRVERGTMNRAIYQLATFFDPRQPNAPWAPPKGWNGKLLWAFGAGASASRFQTGPNVAVVFNDTALRQGFMVASSSQTDNGTNANHTLAAEMVMMVKEHIAETYGPIRYTIGTGCSGGSIMQHVIAGTYPGLLNGLQPNCSYQDQVAIELEIKDCGLLQSRYFATADGIALSPTQQAAIEGKVHTGFCSVWVNSFVPAYNPGILNPATGSSNCGAGFPAALVYDPVVRPNGVRCTLLDNIAPQLGTFVDTDGHTKANRLFDNVGVQYGLRALQAGVITPEDFVRLNQGVGSYSADLVWSGPAAPGSPAKRIASTEDGLETAYGAGLVVDGRQLAKVAIIDLRGNQNPAGDIHSNWRSWGQRERLDHANGHHDNQVIWASTPGLVPGAALARKAFLTMDAWLSSVESDSSRRSLQQKIVANKPSAAHDFCLSTTGATDAEVLAELPLGSAACPVKFQGSPRQAAGGPLSENILKCSTKPLDFFSADYNGFLFDANQKAALKAVFPTGVCDWSKRGVEQVRAEPWTTFADGPGGRPLGDPPVSGNGCGRSDGKDNDGENECRGQSGDR